MTLSDIAVLRPLREEDKARLLTWRNTPDVALYMYTDHHISEAEHNLWFERIMTDDRRSYWLIETDKQPVGLANLYDIDRQNRRCAWAYYLAEPSTRGKGIGTAVEYLMIEKAFSEFQLDKLWCEVLASNEAVWKLHQKFGFEIEARLRRHVVKDQKAFDVIGLGLLKSDWIKVRNGVRERLENVAARYTRNASEPAR